MKTQSAICAKAIKAELTKAYPNIKFSVSSENFSMGNAVRVSYEDGPTTEIIEAITEKYQYGHFDGMTDMYENSNRRDDLPQAKYVTVSRHMSETTKLSLIEKLSKIWQGFSYDSYVESAGLYGYNLTYREFIKMSL
jgi:Large polyvalent protein associated domain 29